MKTCNKCSISLPLEKFNKDKSRKDGRAYTCKKCMSTLFKNWQSSRPKELNTKRADDWKSKRKAETRECLLEYLARHPCVDCKTPDVRVLQFDHRDRKDKVSNVSALIHRGLPWDTVLEEIEKCEVRCANCHMIRTGVQFKYWNVGHCPSG